MIHSLVTFLTYFLAGVMLWAAAAKALRPRAWRAALGKYGLPRPVENVSVVGVPAAEAAAAAVLIVGPARVGAALTVALLALFCLGILRVRMLEGDKVPCGCFGRTQERDYRVMITRNVLLGVLAGTVLLLGGDKTAIPSGAALPAALSFVGVVVALWALSQVTSSVEKAR